MPVIQTNTVLRQCHYFTVKLASSILYFPFVIRYYCSSLKNNRNLHVGCGKNRFSGWINADIHPRSDMIIFLQKRLPFRSGLLEKIYCEHVLEHVTFNEAIFFLKEAYRTLKSGGVLRIAMPDIDDIVEGYTNNWRKFDWVNWPEFSFIETKAEMINMAFRCWGHQHLYNTEELLRALRRAGFSNITFEKFGCSRFPELRGLETRLDSKLIAEAIK